MAKRVSTAAPAYKPIKKTKSPRTKPKNVKKKPYRGQGRP